MRVLEAARRESERNPAPTDALILEKYGPQFDAAMQALGETLADFFGESSRPPDLDTIRSKFLEPILSLSHSLPIFRRAEEWQRNKDKTGSLHPSLLEGRAIGFDAETLVLDHFYQNTIFARSLRSRVASLARLLTEEVRRRRAATGEEVRLLILGANSVLQFPLTQARIPQTPLFAMIVDGDTAALRTARTTVEATLGIRPAVLRAKPYDLVTHIGQLGGPFDIVCTLLQYDLLPPEAALKVTAAAWEVLKPGGAFFTGVYLKTVPRSARAGSRAIADLIGNTGTRKRGARFCPGCPTRSASPGLKHIPCHPGGSGAKARGDAMTTGPELDEEHPDPEIQLIASRLEAVGELLQRISDEVGQGTVRGADSVIERRRPELYAAMEALGETVYHFTESRPTPERLAAVQRLVIGRLQEYSQSSPITLYGSQGKRSRMSYFEVVEHVRASRASGADVRSRAFDDYYVRPASARRS